MKKDTPPKGSIKKFWKGIWGEEKAFLICLQAVQEMQRKKMRK